MTRVSEGPASEVSDTARNDNGSEQEKWQTDTSYTSPLAKLRTGKWLDEQKFEPLHEVVPGLIPAGLVLFVGKPKIGKSWAMGNVLLAAAAGGHALGKIPVGAAQTVMYFALEDGDRRMQSRCRAILGEGKPIPELFNYLTEVPPGRIVATIEEYLDAYPKTTLLVLDTLGRVMPNAAPGESSYQRDYRIGSELKRIADRYPKLALVVIHHDRKAESSDFIDAVSGTQGLAGSADTIVLLTRKRNSTEGLIKVTGRDIAEAEYAVTMSEGRFWTIDGNDLAEAATNARRREESGNLSETSTSILDYVREHPEGVQAGTLAERFGKDVYSYLKRQVEAGRLIKPKRGLYLVPPAPEPPEVPEVPETQVRPPIESDTPSVRNTPVPETVLAVRDLASFGDGGVEPVSREARNGDTPTRTVHRAGADCDGTGHAPSNDVKTDIPTEDRCLTERSESKAPADRTCPGCHAPLAEKRRDAEYCGATCRQRFAKRRQRAAKRQKQETP